jgi:hypothetical protein
LFNIVYYLNYKNNELLRIYEDDYVQVSSALVVRYVAALAAAFFMILIIRYLKIRFEHPAKIAYALLMGLTVIYFLFTVLVLVPKALNIDIKIPSKQSKTIKTDSSLNNK